MSVFSDVLSSILPLFALIIFGYIAKKVRLLHATDAPVLNRFVISITLPAFVFHALLTHRLESDLLQIPFVFWAAELMVIGIGIGIAKLLHWPMPAIGTLAMQSIFGNTGYIGYPMATAIIPERLPAAVIIDQFGLSVPLYPGAPMLGGVFGKSRSGRSAKLTLEFLKTPAFLALILGIVLNLFPTAWTPHDEPLIMAGHFILKVIGMIGSVTVPVVLIAVGLLLRPSSLALHGKKVFLIGILKLLMLPLVVWLIARFAFHIGGTLLEVCVMQAAMPPSATATVFAGQYDMDSGLAIATFFALTVTSAITLPLMLGLLR